jgi:hypothetical protein
MISMPASRNDVLSFADWLYNSCRPSFEKLGNGSLRERSNPGSRLAVGIRCPGKAGLSTRSYTKCFPVSGPTRVPNYTGDYGNDSAIAIPDFDALIVSFSADITHPSAGKPLGRKLGLPRSRILPAFSAKNIDQNQLRARPAHFRQVAADFVGFVKQDSPAIGGPRRAARIPAGICEAPQSSSVGVDYIDGFRLQDLLLARGKSEASYRGLS